MIPIPSNKIQKKHRSIWPGPQTRHGKENYKRSNAYISKCNSINLKNKNAKQFLKTFSVDLNIQKFQKKILKTEA